MPNILCEILCKVCKCLNSNNSSKPSIIQEYDNLFISQNILLGNSLIQMEELSQNQCCKKQNILQSHHTSCSFIKLSILYTLSFLSILPLHHFLSMQSCFFEHDSLGQKFEQSYSLFFLFF